MHRVGGDELVARRRRRERPSIILSHCRPISRRMSSDISWPAAAVNGIGICSTCASSGIVVVERLHRAAEPAGICCSRVVSTLHLREDRRAGVVAAELAHLPLARQHPERVAHLGPQRAVELVGARPALEPVPRS